MLAVIASDPNLLKRITIGDEKFVYSCHIEIKAQSSPQWKCFESDKSTSSAVKCGRSSD